MGWCNATLSCTEFLPRSALNSRWCKNLLTEKHSPNESSGGLASNTYSFFSSFLLTVCCLLRSDRKKHVATMSSPEVCNTEIIEGESERTNPDQYPQQAWHSSLLWVYWLEFFVGISVGQREKDFSWDDPVMQQLSMLYCPPAMNRWWTELSFIFGSTKLLKL